MMERHLTKDLSVPKHEIQSLLGSKEHTSLDKCHIPTPVNIIQTLVGLIDNAEIQNGDNVIIYFSGHGTGYSTMGYCANVNDSIEALCSINHRESNGLHIPDISNWEIDMIFQNISCVKGHHITFILDCSHAGTATAAAEQGVCTLPPLSSGSPKYMFNIANDNSRQFPRYQSVCMDKWCLNMSSHVVLVACQEHQVITEMRKDRGFQGVFTELLVCILTSGTFNERSTVTLIFYSCCLQCMVSHQWLQENTRMHSSIIRTNDYIPPSPCNAVLDTQEEVDKSKEHCRLCGQRNRIYMRLRLNFY